MKQKLLLLGAHGFGSVVLEHAANRYDCAFIDDEDTTDFDGVRVIGKMSDTASFTRSISCSS